MEAKDIVQVVEALEGSAKRVIEEYTRRIIIASVVWLVLGVAILCAAFSINPAPLTVDQFMRVDWYSENVNAAGVLVLLWVARGLLVLVGGVITVVQIIDLAAPRAAAIKDFITDLPSNG